MSGWSVPLSSSPPSTPGPRGFRQSHVSDYDAANESFASNPSTTPAGPPPSARSFTPADPPPSSILGSSQLGSGKMLFKSRSPVGQSGSFGISKAPSFTTGQSSPVNGKLFAARSPAGIRQAAQRTNDFYVSSSSPPPRLANGSEEEDTNEEDEVEGYSDDPQEGSMEVDSDAENQHFDGDSTTRSQPNGSIANGSAIDWAQMGSSVGAGTPRGIKRSRGGAAISHAPSHRKLKEVVSKKDSAIPSIAKSMATQFGVARLDDPDTLILKTEDLVGQLYNPEDASESQEIALETTLPAITEELDKIWQSYRDQDSRNSPPEDVLMSIGPSENAHSLHKATYLSSLLLQLHHPPAAKGKQAFAASRTNLKPSLSSSFSASHISQRPTSFPKVLLDWLDKHHNPYRTIMADLQTSQPSPTAHSNYWDIIFSSTLRGKASEIIKVLQRSDFQYARTAREDGQGKDGYHGTQLGNIKRVISRAIQVLELCPTLQDGNWDVTRNDWIIFRKRVEQAMADLATFAEGRDRDLDPKQSTFEAPNFGIRSSTASLSQSARRAESHVPWTIYQNLKTMYGMLLGGSTEIVASAQDWVEATIGLTAWWDGDEEDDEVAVGSLAMTRRSLRQSQSRGGRLVDLNPSAAYLRRLALSFERATDDSSDDLFQINSANPVEVGLASVFEGNVEGVIGLLRGWSLPVADAVVEIASLGGWFEPSQEMQNGLDESDLLVLSSYGHREQRLSKDGIMVEYAERLFEKDEIIAPRAKHTREGWELSIQILARLEDRTMANKRVVDLLSHLPLVSDLRVDKILEICQDFGMDREARNIAKRYADSIAESSGRYGTALIYYSRAHSAKKVKDVLDLLISLSLVQSYAFPPLSSIDQNLHALVSDPKKSLDQIADLDPQAAEMLHTYLTGYATLRRFYDLRDEELNLKEGQKPTLRPIARKRAAAECLLAVINSAADNIHGGLYDESRGSVVQVDGLLALLGEALVFIRDSDPPLLTPDHLYALLHATEDLQTSHPRLYASCESCFRSTLSAYHSNTTSLPSPGEIFKKSRSDMTGSSGFSLVGSSMMEASDGGRSRSRVGNADMVKRAWDWRKGMKKDAKGEDVCRILRLGVARALGRCWSGEE